MMRQETAKGNQQCLTGIQLIGGFENSRAHHSAFKTLFGFMLIGLFGLAQANDSITWDNVNQSGHILLMRHALAPGTGDPVNFNVEDCSTQRNLSDSGRNQAKVIGQQLRDRGLNDATVYSSQWCRCLETARLLDLGKVEELPVLNSFFRNFQKKEPQTNALKAWLTSKTLKTPVVLVTHQVNITALTEIFPRSGEIIVVRKTSEGGFEAVGRLLTSP